MSNIKKYTLEIIKKSVYNRLKMDDTSLIRDIMVISWMFPMYNKLDL